MLLDVDVDVVAVFLLADGEHLGPALRLEFAPHGLDLLDRFGAVGVIQADDVDADALQAADELGGLGLLPGDEAGGELEDGGGKVDFDELALGGGQELADVDVTGLGFGGETNGGKRQRQTGGDEIATGGFQGRVGRVEDKAPWPAASITPQPRPKLQLCQVNSLPLQRLSRHRSGLGQQSGHRAGMDNLPAVRAPTRP